LPNCPWLSGKLVQIKTWEIKLLDDKSEELGGMTLRNAMMDLCHPTNKKFNLFHTIDKHFHEKCHVLTILKLAELEAHTMIAAMLPYLLWQYAQSKPGPNASALKKWFKLAARCHAEDAFWCLKDECIKNQSDLMLVAALGNDNTLYWESDTTKPPSPKCKQPQAKEESLDDSVLTVMAMSVKKAPKSALKGTSQSATQAKSQTHFANDSKMVSSQVTTFFQLTEMVSVVQQESKMIMSHFDQLTEQIAALISAQENPQSQCPAGGHRSESSHPK